MAPDFSLTLLPALDLVARVRDRAFVLAVRKSFAAWGNGTTIRLPFRVSGARAISFGADVVVGEGSWFQTIGAGSIAVGDRCQFSGYAVISSAGSVVIERDVLVARNVHILDHQHRYEGLGVPVHAQGISLARPVRIGQGSWIGANVVILSGVTVGRQAVVGANSVVRSDVPAGTVVAGAPARVISTLSGRQTLEECLNGSHGSERETPGAAAQRPPTRGTVA